MRLENIRPRRTSKGKGGIIKLAMKKFLIIFIISGVLFAANAQASILDKLPKADILPDNPLYVLKIWYEKIITFISFGDAKKAERYSKLAEERLKEAEQMAQKGKQELTDKALKEYQKFLDKALAKADEMKKQALEDVKKQATEKAKQTFNQAIEKVSESTLKNQEVLLRIYTLVPEPAREAIEKVITITKTGYERAAEALSGSKKEELKQRAEEIKIRAQELIKNWQQIFK